MVDDGAKSTTIVATCEGTRKFNPIGYKNRIPSETNNPEGLLCIVRNLLLAFTDEIEQEQ